MSMTIRGTVGPLLLALLGIGGSSDSAAAEPANGGSEPTCGDVSSPVTPRPARTVSLRVTVPPGSQRISTGMDGDGRTVVLDRASRRLTVLDPAGAPVAEVSVPAGPELLAMDVHGTMRLVLLQRKPAALSFYQLRGGSLAPARVVPLHLPGEEVSPLSVRWGPGGELYVSALQDATRGMLFRVDAQTGRGALVHRFAAPRTFTSRTVSTRDGQRHERSNTFPIPFAQQNVWATTPRGVVVGDGRDYTLFLHGAGRRPARVHAGTPHRAAISDAEWTRWMTGIYGVPRDALARYTRPAHKVPVGALTADEAGGVWVHLARADGEAQALYDVLDLSRRCVTARVALPATERLLAVRGDSVYTVRFGGTSTLHVRTLP